MSILIYIDTNIYLDYLLNRKNESGKVLGPEAFKIFHRTIECEFQIIISDKILEELYGNIEPSGVKMLFTLLKKKLTVVPYTEDELKQAEKLDSIDRNDALHAILANKHNAKYIVTRNMPDFKKFRNLIEPKFPSDV